MTCVAPIRGAEKLSSRWAPTEDLGGFDMPIRLEGEIGDVMVRGIIPDSVDGTFYRICQDHYTPTLHGHWPISGHGAVSAFRIHKGRVDFKIRYVKSDRYKLERNRRQSYWVDVLDHPLANHPCIRAVLDQTSNTNVVYWAGKLLALTETGPAYSMDPHSLETIGLDPFGNQISTPSFTAHPKIDPNVDQLVTWSATVNPEIISYSINRAGNVLNEHRIKLDFPVPCHDIAITTHWIVFCVWPARFNHEGKSGEPIMTFDTGRPACFIVSPRCPDKPLEGSGWKPYETRSYHYPLCSEIVHTAGAWESNGKIYFEGTWPHDVLWPFWPRTDGKKFPEEIAVDFVRVEIDPTQPAGSQVPDPVILVDTPNEFPRIDERFMCKEYNFVFMNIYHSPDGAPLTKHIFSGLNAVAMLDKRTGKLKVYYPGPRCRCQEPVFIPRSDHAPEGDGHVIFTVDRLDINLTNVVILDTKEFETPIAVIELPMRMRAQIHGNWVDAREIGDRNLVEDPPLHNMVWQHKPGPLMASSSGGGSHAN